MPRTMSEDSPSPSGLTTASTTGCAAATPGWARTISKVSSGSPASPAITSSCVLPAIRSTVWRMETFREVAESWMAT